MSLGSTFGSSFGTGFTSSLGSASGFSIDAVKGININREEVFERNDTTELYCTNCDRYFNDRNFFDHVKSCDRDLV